MTRKQRHQGALVTGGGKGIAARLAADGMRVVITDIDVPMTFIGPEICR